jgi:hypothetical protein
VADDDERMRVRREFDGVHRGAGETSQAITMPRSQPAGIPLLLIGGRLSTGGFLPGRWKP